MRLNEAVRSDQQNVRVFGECAGQAYAVLSKIVGDQSDTETVSRWHVEMIDPLRFEFARQLQKTAELIPVEGLKEGGSQALGKKSGALRIQMRSIQERALR